MNGTSPENVTITAVCNLTATEYNATTNSTGHYVISDIPAGDFVVSPAKSGFIFIPMQSYASVGDINVSDVDFDIGLPLEPNTFDATATSRSQISLTWVIGNHSDRTYIRYNAGATPPVNRTDGTLLYNDTGTATSASGLGFSSLYSFSAWGYNATYSVWSENYTIDSATTLSNQAPSVSNMQPTSGSTDVALTPTLNVTVSDPESDTMTVRWYSNSSGSWVQFGINASVSAGTYRQSNSNFSGYNTTYYWYVTVNDGYTTTTSATSHFTTIPAPANIALGTPSPSNGSTIRVGYTTWSIPIVDTEGGTFSWTIECSNGQSDSGTNETSGTKSVVLTNLDHSSNFTVWVNVTADEDNASAWYIFYTGTPGGGDYEGPPYYINITVVDSKTKVPIAQALVSCSARTELTDEKGNASFVLWLGSYLLTVKKQGYKTHTGNILVYENQEIVINLKKSVSIPFVDVGFFIIALFVAFIIFRRRR